MAKNDTDKKLRDKIVNQHKVLLDSHWDSIKEFANESPSQCVGVGFTTSVDLSSDELEVKTTIGFKQSVKDSMVEKFNPDQVEMFDEKDVKPKRKKGKRTSKVNEPST